MMNVNLLRNVQFKNSVWIIGIPSFLFGTVDRSVAAFADSFVSPLEFFYLFTTTCLLVSWICLKPELDEISDIYGASFVHPLEDSSAQNLVHLSTQSRMQELQEYHVVSQVHLLPFPYICQIYHLLNLKHLETVHNFSLGSLKVVGVSGSDATPSGGTIKFQTTLDSPLNILKIWRRAVVEVDLTLHTLNTIELSVPAYGGKKIIVMFNVFPVDSSTHELLIDIYTDLRWPKALLKLPFHIASLLTLYEDLPYLKKLSERNLGHLLKSCKASHQETMWLFKRFAELYTSSLEKSQSASIAGELVEA